MGADFCVIIVLVLHTTAQGINQTLKTNPEAELTKRFLDEYAARGPFGRPLADVADLVNVTFGISLLQIMDLDEKNQVLTISVWDHYIWQDAFLTWEPGSYSGVTSIRLPYRRIWKPDITLYNYADERLEARRDSHVAVFYTGEVQWNPQAIYKSSCKIEIRRFPFDTQNCHLKFGSWTYSAQRLDLAFGDGLAAFDLSRYTVNNEWAMVGNVAVKREQNYTCCNETFQDLTFYLRLRRMSDLYSYILVIPCVLLSSLTLVLFWIPPQSPAKVQLGINIFVAFFVMMLILEESIPTAADSVPMIGRFYMTNMILITLSSFLAVLVANVALSADGKPVPRWANKIFVELLGKALCVNRSAESGHPETTDTPGTGNKTISSVCQKPGSPCQVTTSPGLDYDVHQISKDIKRAVAATTQTRMKVQREREWSTLARVIDRFLFAIYLVVILSSFVLLFPPETDDGSFQPEQSDS